MCVFKIPSVEKLWLQREHLNCLFPSWTELICFFKAPFLPQLKLQSKHLTVSFPGTQYHGTGFCQGQVHTVPYRTSARRARVLWNCMNESLAKPVPWYWVPGRGILRHYSFKLQSLQKNIFLTFCQFGKNLWNQLNMNTTCFKSFISWWYTTRR